MDNLIKEQIKFKINDIDKLFLDTFRHFYRHAYSFQLKWEKMEALVDNINYIWEEVKQSLENFISL